MLTHHADGCPARMGQPCTCGPLGYRGSIEDGQQGAPVVGPVFWTIEQARTWQQEQQTATHAFEAATAPASVNGSSAPAADTGTIWADRPVDTHGYQATPQPNTVAAVVDDFLDAARSGSVTDAGGRPYDPDEVRDMRWSLRGYVTSEIGTMRIADLSGPVLRAFVGDLDAAGFAQARTRAVVRALRALLQYAADRGMVARNTPDQLLFGDSEELPYAARAETQSLTAAAPAAAAVAPSGFVSDEVIWMILKIVTLVFALIALVLVAESV
jgi:hypothetical protein